MKFFFFFSVCFFSFLTTIYAVNLTGHVNPDLKGHLNPDSVGRVNPNLKGRVKPDLKGHANPYLKEHVNPYFTGHVNPDLKGHVNPDLKGHLNPDLKGHLNPDLERRVKPDLAERVNPEQAGRVSEDCLEKEKSLALLETVEKFLLKAQDSFPSCKEDTKPDSDCCKTKSLAYIEMSKKMISDVIKIFPTCSNKPDEKDKEKDKVVEDKVVVPDKKFADCTDVKNSGKTVSGVYKIWPGDASTPLEVYCDMDTASGGWTVIQRRGKFSVQQDFFKDWESYKNGFGNLKEEFWLGNENIRVLCAKGCEIRFDLTDQKGAKGYAQYDKFKLTNDNYRLSISGYKGDIGDSMIDNNNNDFSTKDKGDTSKAREYQSGWWHGNNGYYSNLNGIYQADQSDLDTVRWYTWKAYDNLGSSEMKIRRVYN